MTMRSWIRKLFTRPVRTIRKTPRRTRLVLEQLEPRECPSTFTVNNTLDDGSTGSLRWAVSQANTTSGANTINFGSLFNTAQTITLSGSQLELSNTTGLETITGAAAGVTISGGGASRVFQVDAGVTASFSGLTISGGTATSGGGLYNSGTLALTNCTLSGNTAQGASLPYHAGGNGYGGAILNNSALTLTNCTLSDNTARGGAGATGYNGGTYPGGWGRGGGAGYTGGNGQGGAIYNRSTLTLTNCTLGGNTAQGGYGGNGGNGNPATQPGGGVTTGGSGGAGGNGNGGAIFTSSRLTLTNCTLSGNAGDRGGGGREGHNGAGGDGRRAGSPGSGQGGAIANQGTSYLCNTIVAGNTASSLFLQANGPDVSGAVTSNGNNLIGITDGSSGWIASGAAADLTGTAAAPLSPVLAALGNYGGPTQTMALLPGSPAIDAGISGAGIPTTDQRGQGRVGATDIGAFESQGFTLTPVAATSQAAGTGAAFNLTLNVTANSALEPVNGGIVHLDVTPAGNGAGAWFVDPNSSTGYFFGLNYSVTVASGQAVALAGPNAVDGSYTVLASATGAPAVSFALTNTGTPFTNLVVNTTSGTLFAGPGLLSLPLAVLLANIDGVANTITFDPTVFAMPRTITLGHQLELSDTAGLQTITGPVGGMTISGAGLSRVFQVDAGVTAAFSGLTISGGSAGSGGVLNDGTLTLTNCTISGNTASASGGGLLNQGTMALTNCTISGNSATKGGGLLNQGTMTLTNCTISENSVNGFEATGAGLNNYGGTLTLTNCTISGNTAGPTTRLINTYKFVTYGSGLYNTGTATLTNTIVAGNRASYLNPNQAGSVDLSGTLAPASSNNLIGGNPVLGPLGNYGGPTQTMPLLPGSPAIDAGISGAGIPTTDERAA